MNVFGMSIISDILSSGIWMRIIMKLLNASTNLIVLRDLELTGLIIYVEKLKTMISQHQTVLLIIGMMIQMLTSTGVMNVSLAITSETMLMMRIQENFILLIVILTSGLEWKIT